MRIITGILSIMSVFSNITNTTSQDLCLGDVDDNLIVDVNDLLGVLSQFSQEGDLVEDIDMSGSVDVNDILMTLSNFGTDCNDVPVTEPEIPCVLGDECGGQVWNECGTSCPPLCGSPEPMMCNMMCNVGFQCPNSLWWDDVTNTCVEREMCQEVKSLPPDIAIGRPFLKKNENQVAVPIESDNDWN
jgi:hypothetical protein